jgi:hypothetical protein
MGGPYTPPQIEPGRRMSRLSRVKSVLLLTLMAAGAVGIFVAAMILGSILAAVILLGLVIAMLIFWLKFMFSSPRRQL